MSEDFMKKPCQHCPFRKDVQPFLTNERAEELAYAAQNPYNSFPCHKTTVHDDESDDGDMLVTENSKECAGFLTLRACENGESGYESEGFEPSFANVYSDVDEMIYAYQDENER